jgi:CO/xanthine dehydrogenase FAD-binding subunit
MAVAAIHQGLAPRALGDADAEGGGVGDDGIGEDAGALTIGALATHDAIERSELVRGRWTALADASAIVGSPATRLVGTLGGNLANASPAMETGAPLAVFGAEVELRSSSGSRTVAVSELWSGPGRTIAAPGEMITAVRVPAPADGSGSAYVRLEYRRAMEIAVVGSAALVTLGGDGTVADARVALTAVAPTIVRSTAAEDALRGSAPSADAIAAAATAVHDAAAPISDVRGSDVYRRAMIEVMARRAIDIAARRAAGEAVPIPATMTVGGTR